jgi:hypothetical protein
MGKAHNKTYFINRNMHGFVESPVFDMHWECA